MSKRAATQTEDEYVPIVREHVAEPAVEEPTPETPAAPAENEESA